MPYDYDKHCPNGELKVRITLAIIIYIGLVTAVYTLASVYF